MDREPVKAKRASTHCPRSWSDKLLARNSEHAGHWRVGQIQSDHLNGIYNLGVLCSKSLLPENGTIWRKVLQLKKRLGAYFWGTALVFSGMLSFWLLYQGNARSVQFGAAISFTPA